MTGAPSESELESYVRTAGLAARVCSTSEPLPEEDSDSLSEEDPSPLKKRDMLEGRMSAARTQAAYPRAKFFDFFLQNFISAFGIFENFICLNTREKKLQVIDKKIYSVKVNSFRKMMVRTPSISRRLSFNLGEPDGKREDVYLPHYIVFNILSYLRRYVCILHSG